MELGTLRLLGEQLARLANVTQLHLVSLYDAHTVSWGLPGPGAEAHTELTP